MAGDRTLTVKILGDATSAQRALGHLDDSTGKTEGRFAKFGAVAKAAALGAGLAAIKFGKDSVDAFKESEQAQSRLEAAFAKFPTLAGANIEALRALNTELARKTVFDDDATASGQAVLAGFKLTGEQLQTLTPLLQDYASRTGKDLPTAAQDLGKAILGQGRALKAIGVDFKDTGTEAGNFARLTDVLRDKVGGFAEKEGKTAAGQAQILRNQFGELQEKVGSVLVPALTTLANVGLTVVSFFQNLNPGVQVAIGVVAGLTVAVLAISKAVQAWTAIQAALNVVLALNPIALVVLAVAALAAGIVIAYKNSETFRNVVQAAFGAVKTYVEAATFPIRTIINLLGDAIGLVQKLARAIPNLPSLPKGLNKVPGIPFLAHGGIARAGRPHIVGEEGPELFIPGTTGTVIPNNRLAAAGGAVVNNYYSINVGGSVVTERDLIDAVAAGLEAKRRRNGPGDY